MSQMSWTFDAPTGVYKNHKLSAQLRKASIAQTVFMQFVKPEPGYGKKNGESVTITRISNIAVPSSPVLDELRRIPEDKIVRSTQAITVVENGRSVPYTSFDEDLSHIDLRNAVQRQLMNQMSLSMDIQASDAASAGQVKAIPDGVASITFDTDGTASTTATVNMNTFHVEQIRDYMFSTLNVEFAVGNDYVAIAATKAKRGLMDDPNWEEWKKYTDPEAKFNSEIGRFEQVRFIESNHTSAASGSLGSGGVLGEAFFMGADALAIAIAVDPELRAKQPDDFGRDRSVAWYGIYKHDQIWKDSSSAGEARVVHVTSA